MDPAIWGFIGVLAGAVIGAAASIGTTVITARNARKLQSDADTAERTERFRAFQRDTLLELQNALAVKMRLVAKAHMEDLRSCRENGVGSGVARLPDELDQELLEASRHSAALTERVASDPLRIDVKELLGEMAGALLAGSEAESTKHMEELADRYKSTMEHLGRVLRETY